MKLFEIPMVATSLMALGFLMGLEASPARADFTFDTPVPVKRQWDHLVAGWRVNSQGIG